MKAFAVLTIMLVATVLLAEGIDVPEGDPLQALLGLITSWSAMSPIMIGSAIVTIVVQSVRKFLPSSKARKAVVVLGGVVWAVLQALINGLGLVEALVMVLLTMGGAVAIYEWVIKPFTVKKADSQTLEYKPPM